MFTFALVKQNNGAIAQLVEQRPPGNSNPETAAYYAEKAARKRQ